MVERDFAVRNSAVIMTQLVLPNDTNPFGTLLGGQLMHWIDLAAGIAASRHTKQICVTASVDELDFFHPIREGEVVLLHASVNRVFKTSMEVGVKVLGENLRTGSQFHANSAYLTFVAIDKDRKPIVCYQITPESDEEKRRYQNALERRERRLEHRKLMKKA